MILFIYCHISFIKSICPFKLQSLQNIWDHFLLKFKLLLFYCFHVISDKTK